MQAVYIFILAVCISNENYVKVFNNEETTPNYVIEEDEVRIFYY